MPKIKSFVLATGRMTTKRIVIKPEVIHHADFDKNPVMLYNHQPGFVPGKWENLRVQDGKFWGDPIFDDGDEEAVKLKGKTERGFIVAASISVRNIKGEILKDEDGEYVNVTYCELREVSIVDIPSDSDAVRFLDSNDKEVDLSVVNFSDVFTTVKIKTSTMKKVIASIVGLSDDASEVAIQEAVTAAFADSKELKELKKKLAADQQKKAAELVDAAIADGRLQKENRETFLELADNNYDLFEKTINGLPKAVRLSDVGRSSAAAATVVTGREKWTFSDYQKNDPKALEALSKSDPAKFKELYSAEFGDELED